MSKDQIEGQVSFPTIEIEKRDFELSTELTGTNNELLSLAARVWKTYSDPSISEEKKKTNATTFQEKLEEFRKLATSYKPNIFESLAETTHFHLGVPAKPNLDKEIEVFYLVREGILAYMPYHEVERGVDFKRWGRKKMTKVREPDFEKIDYDVNPLEWLKHAPKIANGMRGYVLYDHSPTSISTP